MSDELIADLTERARSSEQSNAELRAEVARLRRRVEELMAALRPFADRTAGLEHWAAAERLLSEVK